MPPASRYRINTPLVACQTLEHESILIHFQNGSYFSAEGLGAAIVELVEWRRSVEEIVARAAGLREGDPDEARTVVAAFLVRLLEEGLIVPDAAAPPVDALPPTGPPCPGATPELRTYTDLQDLLLLDPIHDSGDAGWPAPPSGEA